MSCIEVEFQHGVLSRGRRFRRARIRILISVDSLSVMDTHVEVEQVGTGGEDEAIEVGHPGGYDGPWDHAHFSLAAACYYRDLVERRRFEIMPKARCRFEVEEEEAVVLDGWSLDHWADKTRSS